MKKILILVVLLTVAFGVKAQSLSSATQEMPTDSVSILFRQLQNTNAEIVRLNRSYTINATMVSIGGGFQLIGTGMMMFGSTEKSRKIGMASSLIGTGLMILSIIPMPKGVHVDNRGFVVDLPEKKKK